MQLCFIEDVEYWGVSITWGLQRFEVRTSFPPGAVAGAAMADP
jgi:hypothetical protein